MAYKNPVGKQSTASEWRLRDKISYLQRRLLVYSIMYYVKDESCVTDSYYDYICKLLVKYKQKYPKAWSHSEYSYVMDDFDGTTGFDLPSRLNKKDRNKLERIARQVYKQWKQSGGYYGY